MLTHADVRRRRIGGAVAALIGAALIVLAFLAFTGRLGATGKSDGASEEAQSAGAQASQSADPGASDDAGGSGEAETSAPSEPPASSEAPPDPKAPLMVLNGGGINGLAASAQAEFEAGGWEVAEIGNYVSDVPVDQSTVFYPSGDKQALAAAEALAAQYPELVAVTAPESLGYDGVVVVLAGEWIPGG